MPVAVLLGRDQPWLRQLLGISVAPRVRSISHEALRDNTAKRCNGIAVRRTTESDATNHHPYRVTGKSLDVAGCNAKPLLVVARTTHLSGWGVIVQQRYVKGYPWYTFEDKGCGENIPNGNTFGPEHFLREHHQNKQ